MEVQLLFLSDCHQNKKPDPFRRPAIVYTLLLIFVFSRSLSTRPFRSLLWICRFFSHCVSTPFPSLKSFLDTGLFGYMNSGEDHGTIISLSAFFLNPITIHPHQLTHPATTICHLGLLTVVVTTALLAGRVHFFVSSLI
ncbi:hypothetical protein CSKR_202144 [Clonorchis sinensis]|uniref:Uncharacterized protein n=1 Tax=Clonorchis sinensis TaxID=79923 RepID=A0A8T1LVE8_CLOSI|nr:hypothetical protein CSKR_202144 [Clonorchis sinensis]